MKLCVAYPPWALILLMVVGCPPFVKCCPQDFSTIDFDLLENTFFFILWYNNMSLLQTSPTNALPLLVVEYVCPLGEVLEVQMIVNKRIEFLHIYAEVDYIMRK